MYLKQSPIGFLILTICDGNIFKDSGDTEMNELTKVNLISPSTEDQDDMGYTLEAKILRNQYKLYLALLAKDGQGKPLTHSNMMRQILLK